MPGLNVNVHEREQFRGSVKSVVFQATLKGASTTGNYSGSSAYIHKAALMARPYS